MNGPDEKEGQPRPPRFIGWLMFFVEVAVVAALLKMVASWIS